MTYFKDNTAWVDVAEQHYPRLLSEEDAETFHGGFYQNNNSWAFQCVHGREISEPCVACEGLSILERVRR